MIGNNFNKKLQLIKNFLPIENTLPNSTYIAKKIIDSLRMEYQIIHACWNDCILYWREHENMDSCNTCGLSGGDWKIL